jgi:hypothetical protein
LHNHRNQRPLASHCIRHCQQQRPHPPCATTAASNSTRQGAGQTETPTVKGARCYSFATADDCLGKKSHPEEEDEEEDLCVCRCTNTTNPTDRMFVTCDTVFYCFLLRHAHAPRPLARAPLVTLLQRSSRLQRSGSSCSLRRVSPMLRMSPSFHRIHPLRHSCQPVMHCVPRSAP